MSAAASTRLLPAAARVAVPWKNGGGLTREIAVAPAGADLDEFDWRVSTAEVHTAGPFSSFAGIERTLCVLEGELVLAVEGRAAALFAPGSAPLVFAGDVAVYAEPRGRVVDLNIMTRRQRFEARVARAQFAGGKTRRLCVSTCLVFALDPLAVEMGASSHTLARWDALQLRGPGEYTLLAPAGQGACYLIEIAAAGPA